MIIPHNIGLGATHNPDLVEEVPRITAKEVRATGIQWAFAPCVTVPRDDRWGRTYEGFAEDPALVSELGFEGFLISDYNAIDQVYPEDYKTAIEMPINAGMDMAMAPNKYREYIRNLTELVNEGRVPMERIDDAVTRILRVKFAMGLMDEDRSHLADRSLHASFGSEEHRQVARDAVRQSLVLLKNENATLPLSKQALRIHIGGKNADDIGNQVGGWTIAWQGESGDVTPGGTTILAAIQKAVSASTKVTFSLDGTGAEGADVGIVVIGEIPYAEGFGDRADLVLDEADVLFGDDAPTGTLPFSWPRSMDQIRVNVGDEPYDPLLEYGFGLTY